MAVFLLDCRILKFDYLLRNFCRQFVRIEITGKIVERYRYQADLLYKIVVRQHEEKLLVAEVYAQIGSGVREKERVSRLLPGRLIGYLVVNADVVLRVRKRPELVRLLPDPLLEVERVVVRYLVFEKNLVGESYPVREEPVRELCCKF